MIDKLFSQLKVAFIFIISLKIFFSYYGFAIKYIYIFLETL